MEKNTADGLPTYNDATSSWLNRRRKRRTFRFVAAAALSYFAFYTYRIAGNTAKPNNGFSIERLQDDYAMCATLRRVPVDTSISSSRDHNKRWVKGTKPILIRNATIWTGEPQHGTSEEDEILGKSYEWIFSDVFVDKGLIQKIAPGLSLHGLPKDTQVFDARGRQLTSGIVDMHSHAGLASVANLQDDVNELSADITPFVQSLDSLDPLQPEFQWIKSGGVTTSLLLPGSGNNMGGEAFVIKMAVGNESGRAEVSQQDMLADPEQNWRYMKMACGENPKRVYGKLGEHGPFSRLGESWEFRHALEQAREYVKSQDDWCSAADSLGVENMASYLPNQLRWESLGAVLRGQVRVNTHCYTIPDLEAFVRHTNEFKFRVYAFHHAHQTYLIPEVLKRAYGGTPAAALFADNMYYKVEAYTASEKAGKILFENGITPVYVSDNPVLNSQHVVFEAAKAYGNGLPYHAALAGVTSKPAELLGLGDRIGKVKEGFDADIVVWDSDPLSIGATPVQVWIDGAPQFKDPVELKKPIVPPTQPDKSFGTDLEIHEVHDTLIIKGITNNYLTTPEQSFPQTSETVAIIQNGTLLCIGPCTTELSTTSAKAKTITLKNGYITPPFTAFGTTLGLVEISAQPETQDGPSSPSDSPSSRAADGLLFGGKNLAAAFAHGVTRAISAPGTAPLNGRGVSVGFYTNAKHSLDVDEGGNEAVWKEEVALHYDFTLDAKDDKTPSLSSAVNALRGKLLAAIEELAKENKTMASGKDALTESAYLKRVVSGSLPLVLSAHSADTIASLIYLKTEILDAVTSQLPSSPTTSPFNLIIHGAAESHILARHLFTAKIPIILAPLLPHAQSWDQRRSLTGAPLTNGTTIDALLDAGVLVGISVDEDWESRDLGLLAGIAFANGGGKVGFREALDLVGRNVEKMLGLRVGEGGEGVRQGFKEGVTEGMGEFVVWEGSPLEVGGRVRVVGGRGGGKGGKSMVWM